MRPNRHEVCGVYVNSSIMDEGAIVKTSSLPIENIFHFNVTSLD